MAGLLGEGGRIPSFRLKTPDGREVRYDSFLRRRRIMLIAVSDADAGMRRWLAAARRKADEFAERDMIVLTLVGELGEISEAQRLPEPFFALRDPWGRVRDRIGGDPAFYLVGKDMGIKIASRRPCALDDLFRLVDSMPMRKQEIARRG